VIQNKQDLQSYLKQDQIALGKKNQDRPAPFSDEVWRFQILLRKTEYHVNCAKNPLEKLIAEVYRLRYHKYCVKMGFHIPLNIFGAGLSIAHYGALVVNSKARVGINCRIHAMVVIGATNGNPAAPTLGDNVYIGAGAKIIGDIRIADDVAIGANAVVVKSIDEPGTTWGGAPARKISQRNSHSNLCPDLFVDFPTAGGGKRHSRSLPPIG